MKLYVLENVLTDYTDGMVCILAKNESDAINELYKKDGTACWILCGSPKCECHSAPGDGGWDEVMMKFHKPERFSIQPKVIEKPEAFCVWGGG